MIDRVNIMHREIEPDKLTMQDDWILIEKIKKDKSKGGIWIAGKTGVRTEHCYGRVVSLGRGMCTTLDGKIYPMDLKVGYTILSMDYLGEKMQHTVDDRNFRAIREHAVWAKVKLGSNLEVMDIEPYLNRVLVKITEKGITQGGIQLPASHQLRGYTVARVVKVGPGWLDLKTGYRYPMETKPGDDVIMTRYAGSICTAESEELRLIEERPYMEGDPQPDILCVCEGVKGFEYD